MHSRCGAQLIEGEGGGGVGIPDRPFRSQYLARGGCVVNRELVDTLDWDAVRAWLAR